MDENAYKELESLKVMITAWKGSYVKMAGEMGGSEFFCEEFWREIEEFAFPYVTRMMETKSIDGAQLGEFVEFCNQQVQELRELMEFSNLMKEKEG